MNRRDFAKIGSTFLAGIGPIPYRSLHPVHYNRRTFNTHVVILGGGVGGCAAALAIARSGYSVILTEETDWIGGQLTQQAVPPDEHPWIEQFGATRSYQSFRKAVREYYKKWYPLKAEHAANEYLNPGACGVSYLCHEPRVAHQVLSGMMAPFISEGRIKILTDTIPVQALVNNDTVQSVLVQNVHSKDEYELTGIYFLDATETGDLLPLTGTEYVTGAESQAQTGELHAPDSPAPDNIQAPTWCFAIDYREGENHTIDKPDNYAFWRDYIPPLTPAWPGKLLSLTYSNPITLEPRTLSFDPRPQAETPFFNLWTYRRLIAPSQLLGGENNSGISLINWPQNDYLLGNFYNVSEKEHLEHQKGAMDVSYALLYWLQTEAPRADGKMGWPGLRLRGDVCGTSHGLAKRPYIREARRIKALFTIKEQHVGVEARMLETGLPESEITATSFKDSVGIGSYRIDLHPSTGGDNYIDVSSLPFEIPLGALIPQRMKNLLPACKNLGVTHITNGCYRLHPVEWNIGESAGLTAVHALESNETPQAIHANEQRLSDLQKRLRQHGVEIRWPDPARSPR